MKPWKEIVVGDRQGPLGISRRTATPGDQSGSGGRLGPRAIQHVGQAAWVSVAVAGEKVSSQLKTGAPAALQGSSEASDQMHGGEAPPPAEARADVIPSDVLFFQTSRTPAEILLDGSNAGSEAAIQDLAELERQEPDWPELGFRKLLALLKKLPPEVHEHAVRIRDKNRPELAEARNEETPTGEEGPGVLFRAFDVTAEGRNEEAGRQAEKEGDKASEQDLEEGKPGAGPPEGASPEVVPQTPGTPGGKLTLNAVYTAIKSWADNQRAALESTQSAARDETLETEDGLMMKVKELLAGQDRDRKSDARGSLEPASSGGEREWVFAVKKMNFKMSIGLVSTSAALFHDWFHPLAVNKAWFWQCCSSSHELRGILANGNEILMQTDECFREGSHVAVRLDPATGKVSFWLRDNDQVRLVGAIEGASGVVGEVYPAVCLHVNGDCVEFAPDPPTFAGKEPDAVKESAINPGDGTSNIQTQTEHFPDVRDRPSAYHYAHLSTVSQVSRLLDEAEEVIRPYDYWPSMRSTGWIGKENLTELPALGLTSAKKALRLTRAILDGNYSKARAQVKIVNLPADSKHSEIHDAMQEACGFTPESVSLKSDRDFLHPKDRDRLAPGMRVEMENMTAFVTVSNADEQAQALRLDGLVLRGRRLSVSTVSRADAKALQNKGEQIITLAQRMLTLEHDLRTHSARLQRDTAECIASVFEHIRKGDGSEAKAALERARGAITRLPAGDLLAVEQEHVEEELRDLQSKVDRRAQEGRKQVACERKRLQDDMEARLKQWRSYLMARGERKDGIEKEIRDKRHELMAQNEELLSQLQQQIDFDVKKLREKLNSTGEHDLSKRMIEAEAAVHTAYPWLNFYNVEDMLGRLDWLLDSAEDFLRRIDCGKVDYIGAWECVTSARYLMSLPIGFDDRRKLGLDVDKTLTAVQLHSLHSHWHPVLRAFPERGFLVRTYDLLVARLVNIERLLQSLMRPLREQMFQALRQCTVQLGSQQLNGANRVIEAARSLRTATFIANGLPRELVPKDLSLNIAEVNAEAQLQLAHAHAQWLQQTAAVHATASKPLKDIYISFDCGPPPGQHKILEASSMQGIPISSAVNDLQRTDARGWAILERLKRALTAKGWTVHTGEDYPYHRVYQEIECSRRGEKPLGLRMHGVASRKAHAHGIGDYAECLGMRLEIAGDLTSSSVHSDLPAALALLCRQRLNEMNRERSDPPGLEQIPLTAVPDSRAMLTPSTSDPTQMTLGESLSTLDRKIHVEEGRFEIMSTKCEAKVSEHGSDITHVVVAIRPTQTKVDRCSPETLASAIFSASEMALPIPLKEVPDAESSHIKGCHWPWPLPSRGTELTDYDIKSAQQIQHSWAVLLLVTKRYARACQDDDFLANGKNSKAISEMRNAVWFKGASRIVACLVDESSDGCDVGVPATWRGRMGDMLGDCVSFDFSPPAFDTSIPKLHAYLNNTMAMSRSKPAMPHALPPITAVRSKLEAREEPRPLDAIPTAGGSVVLSSRALPSAFLDAITSPLPGTPETNQHRLGQMVTWSRDDADIPKGSVGEVVEILDAGNVKVKWESGIFQMNGDALNPRGEYDHKVPIRTNGRSEGMRPDASLATALALAESLPCFKKGDLARLKDNWHDGTLQERADILHLIRQLHALDDDVLARLPEEEDELGYDLPPEDVLPNSGGSEQVEAEMVQDVDIQARDEDAEVEGETVKDTEQQEETSGTGGESATADDGEDNQSSSYVGSSQDKETVAQQAESSQPISADP